jgi:hypothetical protein
MRPTRVANLDFLPREGANRMSYYCIRIGICTKIGFNRIYRQRVLESFTYHRFVKSRHLSGLPLSPFYLKELTEVFP